MISTVTPPSILTLIRALWTRLSTRRKRQLGVLLCLMLLTSLAELLSLGAVLPFLGILTSPDLVFNHPAVQPFLNLLNLRTPQELLFPITALFIFAALFAGVMRLLLLYANTKLSFAIGADFSHEIYRRTLYQPYVVHVARNSSQIISGITGKAGTIIQGLLVPLLTLLSSSLMLLAILAMLMSVDPVICIIAFLGFSSIYAGVVLTTRRQLATNSKRIARESTRVVKALQEGLGGIRDVLLDGNQAVYCKNYQQADIPLRHAQASSAIISGAPRFVAEAMGMALIAILAYMMARQHDGVANAITTLGVLALGAQRMLPVLQQCYSSIVAIRTSQESLIDAFSLLSQPIDYDVYGSKNYSLPFEKELDLKGIGFRYGVDGPSVLRDIDIKITRGSCVGFIGATGSGKSTLLDIVMGLLTATEGQILIDGIPLVPEARRAWQQRIAHVPQAIYLADSTIAENIAFGVPQDQINIDRVKKAAEQAQISDHIESLPNKYQTRVGERGVRLSGGQRQRICIARALYKRAEIIVFDEATSALDNNTESAVMESINNLNEKLTVMIIAHRLSTLQNCDQIIELQTGKVLRSGSYSEIVENKTI